jgi:putative flippase GtrA
MNATLQLLAARLPPAARRHLTEPRIHLLAQFTRFGVVGLAGLVVDTAIVYAVRSYLGLYGAGFAAYGVAATTTWWLNRLWTFRGKGSGPVHHQWFRFLAANSMGFLLNRGAYVALVTFLPIAASEPVIATSAGAVAGMFVNFSLSRRLVFR